MHVKNYKGSKIPIHVKDYKFSKIQGFESVFIFSEAVDQS
jgi:hypothetical protein